MDVRLASDRELVAQIARRYLAAADGALQVADLTSEIASIDGAPAAFERLHDPNTMKILIAPNGP